MPEQRPHSWHHQPDIANLSPDSYTAQKLVHASILFVGRMLTSPATCDAGASLPHVEALLHRPHTRTLPYTQCAPTLTHSRRQHG
jgi:hypothetical protein